MGPSSEMDGSETGVGSCWFLGRLLSVTVVGRRMRLVDWGRQYGFDRRTTWQMMKDGRLPDDLVIERVGRIWYVLITDDHDPPVRTLLYARVSSSEQSDDLVRQAERLQRFAKHNSWTVHEVVMETASGLNGKRRKLLRLLGEPGRVRIVVEHRDRLARFGFEMVEACLAARGSELVVVEDREIDDDLVRDVTEILTSMCARLHGRRSARRRAERAVQAVVNADDATAPDGGAADA